MEDTPVMLRVRAGSTAWWSRSRNVTLSAAAPMGTDSPMGNHPSQTENTISSRRASQKAGVLEISRHQPRMSRSGHRPRRAPAVTPRARPSTPDSTQAKSSSPREFPSRSPMIASTGWRYSSEVPKSPRTASASQPRYRSGRGVLVPQ